MRGELEINLFSTLLLVADSPLRIHSTTVPVCMFISTPIDIIVITIDIAASSVVVVIFYRLEAIKGSS